MKSISVFAPATIANVGCAFDVLGLALESPGDTVTASVVDQAGIFLTLKGGADLPADPEKNVAVVSTRALLAALRRERPDWKVPEGLALELKKELPIGSGLGSSSASSAAAVVAVNHLLGSPFFPVDLVPFAMEGERVACGSPHADNVAPAILGGVVLIRSYAPLDLVSLTFPKDLTCVVLAPDVEVKTSDARKILRKEISLSIAIQQWGNIAGLVAGFSQEDPDLIGRSLQDFIIEPERAVLIPGFHQVKRAALDCGALGCGISGAGPALFALMRDEAPAEKAGKAMQKAFTAAGISSRFFISPISSSGAKVVS